MSIAYSPTAILDGQLLGYRLVVGRHGPVRQQAPLLPKPGRNWSELGIPHFGNDWGARTRVSQQPTIFSRK